MRCFYDYVPFLWRLLVRERPKRVLEFGSGLSTLLIGNCLPESEIVSVETGFWWYLRSRLAIRLFKRVPGLVMVFRPVFFSGFFGGGFDFVFVDSETKFRVEHLRLAAGLVRVGGLVLLHDADDFVFPGDLFDLVECEGRCVLLKPKKKGGGDL